MKCPNCKKNRTVLIHYDHEREDKVNTELCYECYNSIMPHSRTINYAPAPILDPIYLQEQMDDIKLSLDDYIRSIKGMANSMKFNDICGFNGMETDTIIHVIKNYREHAAQYNLLKQIHWDLMGKSLVDSQTLERRKKEWEKKFKK